MKQQFLKITSILFLLLISISGCEKLNDKPDEKAKVVSPGKQITSFKIVTPAATGVIDTTNKTIMVTVPMGTALTNLVTEITVAAGHTITPASGAAQNFTLPVVYTVKRPDNTTTQWTATVSTPGVTVDQDISASVTWTKDKIYLVDGNIEVKNSSVLTIMPGTVIKFTAGSSLTIGYSSNATLIANGNAQNPIVFTSDAAAPAAGAWEGLFFDEHTLNNTSLQYCKVEFAGSSSAYGAVTIYGCEITMSHVTVQNSGSYGVLVNYANNLGGFKDFSSNTINNTVKYGMVINAMKLGTVGTANLFTNNPGVQITGDLKTPDAQTWRNLGVPYIISGEVDIDGNLTIEPGTIFKFDAAGWLGIGYYLATTFTADGTSQLPITFTSSATSPVAGAWRGISVYGNTQTNSKMNNCIIDYAGSIASYGALHMSGASSITFTNSTVRNSSTYGIVLDADAGFQTFTGNTISNCANHLITLSFKHLPDLGVPNTLVAASGKGIFVSGDVQYSSDVVWRKQSADFYVSGGETDIDGNVTLEAGSNFRFINDSYFYFGYYANTKLTAIGTATSKITFTSAVSSPAAGAWKGLYFADLTMTNSAMAYCEFFYTGMSGKPAIYTRKSFNVSNTNVNVFSSTHAAEYKTGITVPPGTGNNFTWVAN